MESLSPIVYLLFLGDIFIDVTGFRVRFEDWAQLTNTKEVTKTKQVKTVSVLIINLKVNNYSLYFQFRKLYKNQLLLTIWGCFINNASRGTLPIISLYFYFELKSIMLK